MSVETFEAESGILPIAIRPDLCVQIYGIPHDLTVAEATRLANVVLAMATDAPHPGRQLPPSTP